MTDLMSVAETWWGKKWIENMLQYGRFYRMKRGIKYTQENRVSNLIIKEGKIFAQCQGTAPTPYRIKIRFKPIPDEKWGKVVKKLSKKCQYEAQLLSGIMPQQINQLFLSEDVPLFPEKTPQLNAECTCPDPEIPCKHIAAVILSVAQLFDYDPFLLVKLRGKTEQELLELIEFEQIKVLKQISSQKTSNREYRAKSKQKSRKFLVPDYSKCKPIHFSIGSDLRYDQMISRLGAPNKTNNPKDFSETLKNIYKDAAELANNLVFKKKKL